MQGYKTSFRIYYEDTDAAGVVYYANYLKFAERARTEWLRSLGFDQSSLMKNEKVIFPVFEVKIKYHRPAFLDDELRIETTVYELRKAKMGLHQKIYKDKDLITSIEVMIACVNLENKPTIWPKALLEKLETQKSS